MADSQVDTVASAIHRLVWNVMLEKVIAKLLLAVPFLGWPIIKDIFIGLLDKYLLMPLFEEGARWGIFTSIDFKTDEEYNAYKDRAVELVGSQGEETWNEDSRKAFRDAARDLIVLHPRSP